MSKDPGADGAVEPGKLRRLIRRFPQVELRVLLVSLVILASLTAFIKISEAVVAGGTGRFDAAVLRALRQPTDPGVIRGPSWVTDAAEAITGLGDWSVLTLLLLAVVGFLLLRGRWSLAVVIAVASLGGTLISTLLKNLFERPRPDVVPHLDSVSTLSFPSGHSMLSAVVYLTLGALLTTVLPRARDRAYVMAVSLTIPFLVGLSRCALGVHWPTDVLGGWITGLAWALVVWLGWRATHRGA